MTTPNTISGFGFHPKISERNLCEFIVNHKDAVMQLKQGSEILTWIKEHPTIKDSIKEAFFNYESMTTGDWGIYGIVADIMTIETEIRFKYCNSWYNEEFYEAIIFPSNYPWNFNDRERHLSQKSLTKNILPYLYETEQEPNPTFIDIPY